MTNFGSREFILLTFMDDEKPGSPLRLHKEAMAKLGQIPMLCRALIQVYGGKLGEPTLCGGAVRMEIIPDTELFDGKGEMVAHLALSDHQVRENAQRQPPLPLAQAVTHAHCVDVLHALSKAHEQSGLVASLHSGNDVVELPRRALSDFTQPAVAKDASKRINLDVIGLHIPRHDANIIFVGNNIEIELPHDAYPYSVLQLEQMIFHASARFVGYAKEVKKGVLRAVPGGELLAQHRL